MQRNFHAFTNVWEELATICNGKKDMMYICATVSQPQDL
jgi:hypothetical protein